jgi:pimeloyl-ACP methyl ester carboxylesterase
MQEGFLPARDGGQIYFRRFGQATRALIIPNAVWLAADFEQFARDRSVIFYDPGWRGKSRGPNAKVTLESELEDLDSVVRHFGLERIELFGWSYHGAVIAHYAARHPELVTKLVQCCPVAPRRKPYYEDALKLVGSRLNGAAIGEFMKAPPPDPRAACRAWNSILLPAYFFDPSALKTSRADPCESENEWPQIFTPRFQGFDASLGDWDWRSIGAAFSGPVLILHGEADWNPIEGSREWAESFPNARLEVIPSAGHFPWLEQGPMVFDLLAQFLAPSISA